MTGCSSSFLSYCSSSFSSYCSSALSYCSTKFYVFLVSIFSSIAQSLENIINENLPAIFFTFRLVALILPEKAVTYFEIIYGYTYLRIMKKNSSDRAAAHNLTTQKLIKDRLDIEKKTEDLVAKIDTQASTLRTLQETCNNFQKGVEEKKAVLSDLERTIAALEKTKLFWEKKELGLMQMPGGS